MSEEKDTEVPRPFGEEIKPQELPEIFKRVLKHNPTLNLFDGEQDYVTQLLQAHVVKKQVRELVVDEIAAAFAKPALENKTELLVRAQYFQGGLHHRLSFKTRLIREITFENYPAHVLSLISPVHRVSNLFIAYPSKARPVYLEVPVAGAPPEVRVVEVSIESMRAYSPRTNRVLPKTRYIDGVRVQFVEVGKTEVSGEIKPHGTDEIQINLDPLSSDARKIYNSYLEKEYIKTHHPKHQESAAPRAAKKLPAKPTPETVKKEAIIMIADPILRHRVVKVLQELKFRCTEYATYEEAFRTSPPPPSAMIVLDAMQGQVHAVDLLRGLIIKELLLPTRFVIIAERYSDARQKEWGDLGQGLFLRSSLPEEWIRSKLSAWLNIKPPKVSTTHGKGQRPLILVADDDPDILDLIGSMLTDQKYRVITAASGHEALRSARNLQPDLVLLDINMPSPSGLEVLRTLRSFHVTKDMPVIIISGYQQQETVIQAMKLGITDYIVKPFDATALMKRVREIVQG
ncbi:MAG TPA: response regulator [Bacteroidetes bacterium]|nr:response regulator [Bacteroidota bacterium]